MSDQIYLHLLGDGAWRVAESLLAIRCLNFFKNMSIPLH